MRGVILAGGSGSRLYPLTRVTNKHLLPVGRKPMISHNIDKLVAAGVTDIVVVTGTEHLDSIAKYLGSGAEWGCDITLRVQDEAGGIAHALALCETVCSPGERMCVILGDNIFEDSLVEFVRTFDDMQCESAMCLLKEVKNPNRFGVGRFDSDGQLIEIVEKPTAAPSNFAVTGIYFYDTYVFEIIRHLKPSGRGELEITDVNNDYIKRNALNWAKLRGYWSDAGTHESYAVANALVPR